MVSVNDTELGVKVKGNIKRRSFLGLTTLTMSGIGVLSFIYPLIKCLGPSAEVMSQSTIEVDLSDISKGKTKIVKWRGMPVFIRRRTKEEIEEANSVAVKNLRDPQEDKQRTHNGKEEWLIVIGVCTHLGCVPTEVDSGDKGWYCPCHGSKYDISGRIISGPAPSNLPVPDYYFSNNNTVVIGTKSSSSV